MDFDIGRAVPKERAIEITVAMMSKLPRNDCHSARLNCGGDRENCIGDLIAKRREKLSGTLINLIIQLVAGAIGGNAVGAAANNVSL